MSYEKDKAFATRFIPEMKGIVGRVVVGDAPTEEDQERNTDLVVLRNGYRRFACRVRRHRYLVNFGHEFTIRCERATGAKTELEKVLEGWGDCILYGFVDVAEIRLERWLLGDLAIFREWYKAEVAKGKHPGDLRENDDGTSFLAFDRKDLPASFIIDSYPPIEEWKTPAARRETYRNPTDPIVVREEIARIEAVALSLGWSHARLWNPDFWPHTSEHPRGLASVLSAGDSIVDVGPEFITIEADDMRRTRSRFTKI